MHCPMDIVFLINPASMAIPMIADSVLFVADAT